jgi:hypothetical protein
MPNELETKPCVSPGCMGTMLFRSNHRIAPEAQAVGLDCSLPEAHRLSGWQCDVEENHFEAFDNQA